MERMDEYSCMLIFFFLSLGPLTILPEMWSVLSLVDWKTMVKSGFLNSYVILPTPLTLFKTRYNYDYFRLMNISYPLLPQDNVYCI